jgi:hypothetical protein
VNKAEIGESFTDFYKRKGSTIRYMIMQFDEDCAKVCLLQSLKVDDGKKTLEEMAECLNKEQCYYIFFTINYLKEDLQKEDKCAMMYTPESTSTQNKMVYSSNFNAFFKAYNPGMTSF